MTHWQVGDVAIAKDADEPGFVLFEAEPTSIQVRIEKIYTANGGTQAAWVQRIDGVKGSFQIGLWELTCDPVLYLTHCGRRR